uniref:Uncharacterized protein n=1 Tax=Ciona savignyi TaxID=51511 RepID=H2YPY5_CIOSA
MMFLSLLAVNNSPPWMCRKYCRSFTLIPRMLKAS